MKISGPKVPVKASFDNLSALRQLVETNQGKVLYLQDGMVTTRKPSSSYGLAGRGRRQGVNDRAAVNLFKSLGQVASENLNHADPAVRNSFQKLNDLISGQKAIRATPELRDALRSLDSFIKTGEFLKAAVANPPANLSPAEAALLAQHAAHSAEARIVAELPELRALSAKYLPSRKMDDIDYILGGGSAR